MHVVLLNLAYRADLERPDDLMSAYRSLTGWASAVTAAMRDEGRASGRVHVVQRFQRTATAERDGVVWWFVDDGLGPSPSWWRMPNAALRLAADLCRGVTARGAPAIVHLQGLGYGALVPRLRRLLPPAAAVVVQHHGERPATGVSGLVQGRGLRAADGCLFAARGLADEWIDRGRIPAETPVFEVMEGSTEFEIDDRARARSRTGLIGSPIVLWVGRLDGNKDPLTVLAGLEPVLGRLPGARLIMVHGPDSPLRREVDRRIASSDLLGRAVKVLGTVPHDRMAAIFNSADYFVLGSHHEGLSFAVAEALACGVVPVVTDIPPFRRMTAGGQVGGLWRPGRPATLTETFGHVLGRPLATQSAAARELFERLLSWSVIGREALAAYRIAGSASFRG